MQEGKRISKFLLVMLLLLMVFLAACGKDSPEEESLNRLEEIMDSGVFTVVGSGGYPPFNFFQGEEVVGFDVDTGKVIAEKLGVELEYLTSDWDGLIEGLRAGRFDGILGSMAITPERAEVVNFTIPYYYSGAQLVVRKDSEIADGDRMDGKVIGVATGTTFAEDAEQLGAEVKYYQDDNQTFMELVSGRVDGVITDRLVALDAMEKISGGDELTMSGELLRLEEMAIALNKDDTELLKKLNSIITEMHEEGKMTEISKSWHNGQDITVK